MSFSLDGVSYGARTLMHRFFYGCLAVMVFYFPASAQARIKDYVGPYKYYFSSVKVFSDEGAAWDFRLGEINAIKDSNVCGYSWGQIAPSWIEYSTTGGIVDMEIRSRGLMISWVNNGKCGTNEGGYGETMVRKRLVCLEIHNKRYYPPTDTCESGEFFEHQGANGSNVGPDCDKCHDVGQPITPANGNMWHAVTDYQAPKSSGELTLERIYNSSPTLTDPFSARGFGVRWTHAYNKSLKAEDPQGP
ncbi:DUF6531 domain-containing protein, partial [Massilia antarctica]|uniref:DUF6531 domain-containing protein n=1 Tax=Massilia antarctica TaxID=2765360 RepID=UPI00226E27E1